MRARLAGFAVFSLFALMMVPAHASVTSMSLEKSFYTTDEMFTFIGTQDGKETIFIIIRDSGGNFEGMLSDPRQYEGEFSAIPRPVENFFENEGIYNATAFADSEKEEDGFTIKIEFDGDRIFEVPDVVLQLNTIADKTVEVEKTITFTASITDSSIDDAVFSLSNAPTGATIDSSSGKFVWTPSKSQGNIQDVQYNLDIIVTKGAQEDKENFTITVKQAYVEPEKESEPTPEPTTPEPEELEIPAPFVDKSKDPQSYVDRYNNEASYKEWFDDNYSEYDSIYQAVGLEEPLGIAPFVDESKDPQSYVDRYNDEASYKEWFDDNYSEYDSIYQAVGLEEPEESVEVEEEFGECGEGTDLVDGMCVIIDSEGGGCLIATAAYGTELAPQVQLLREIRDNTVMSTASGTSFMTGFNSLYYSFSPTIADLERENPMFQEAVRAFITPMISTLSIMTLAEDGSEGQVLGLGISVIALNLAMYIAAPAVVIWQVRKRI